jgi:hypothetical protein
LARFVAPFEPFAKVLADDGFDALLAQVLPDHLELAPVSLPKRFSTTITGKP